MSEFKKIFNTFEAEVQFEINELSSIMMLFPDMTKEEKEYFQFTQDELRKFKSKITEVPMNNDGLSQLSEAFAKTKKKIKQNAPPGEKSSNPRTQTPRFSNF